MKPPRPLTLFYDGQTVHEIASPWRSTTNLHGSGCTFSAAITAALALGQPLDQAVQTAKTVVSEAIRQTTGLGQGACPVTIGIPANQIGRTLEGT